MFSGVNYAVPELITGKKMQGLPNRKEASIQMGWEGTGQMNQFQIRKSRNKEVTGKITTHTILNQGVIPQRTPLEPSAQDFERMYNENPTMSYEELEKMMQQHEQQRVAPSRQSKGSSMGGGDQTRMPVRPQESMKGIIFSGVGVGDRDVVRTGSRRTYNLRPEGYGYQAV